MRCRSCVVQFRHLIHVFLLLVFCRVYVGNLDHSLTEGDILAVLSQFGEVDDIHLVREEDTGKSKGFAFAKYEDARSGILAVDNLIGIQVRSSVVWSVIGKHGQKLIFLQTLSSVEDRFESITWRIIDYQSI